MRRTIQFSMLVLGAAVTVRSAVGASGITPIVTSDVLGTPILPAYAAGKENPLYTAQGSGSTSVLHGTGRAANPLSTPDQNPTGAPSTSDFGFAFQSVVTGMPASSGIFIVRTQDPGHQIHLPYASFGGATGAPTINANGLTVFKSVDTSGNTVVCKVPADNPSAATVLATTGTGSTDFASFGKPTVNDAGDVCVTEAKNDGTTGIVVWPVNDPPYSIIPATGVTFSDPQLIGNRLGVIATYPDGTSESLGYSLGTINGKGAAVGPIKWMAPESLQNRFSIAPDGTVAVSDGDSLRTYSTKPDVWSFDATNARTILNVGDPLDGSTVSTLSLSPQSWTGDDLTFYASSADGVTGLYTTSVPEPATVASVLATATILTSRRRRYSHRTALAPTPNR